MTGFSDATTPDAIEPIKGYRIWSLDSSTLDLKPLFRRVAGLWLAGGTATTAGCFITPGERRQLTGLDREPPEEGHPVPHESCTCGFWAMHQRESLGMYTHTLAPFDNYGLSFVTGEVEGWGRVVVGTKGWRSQYARPTCLYSTDENEYLLERVADKYAVPIIRDPATPAPAPITFLQVLRNAFGARRAA